MFKPSEDLEHVAELAARLLERPPNFGRHIDMGQYVTHAPVMAWADRGDDTLAESNFYACLDIMAGAAAHDEGRPEDREDWYEASEGHWLVGSLRTVYVRVWTDDDRTAFTGCWLAAVDMLAALADYPILDESDYSEREYNAWQSVMNDALTHAARDFEEDTGTDQDEILGAFWDRVRDGDCRSAENCSPDEVSWDGVAEDYRTARNVVMERRALEHMPPEGPEVPGAQMCLNYS